MAPSLSLLLLALCSAAVAHEASCSGAGAARSVEFINEQCCGSDDAACSSGVPTSCDAGCAMIFLPFVRDCPEEARPFASVVALCEATAAIVVNLAAPLRCEDESAQLFPVDVELLDDGGRLLYSSDAGGRADCSKLCNAYPRSMESSDGQLTSAWTAVCPLSGGLVDVTTVQFVLPAELARSTKTVRVRTAIRQDQSFYAIHQATEIDGSTGFVEVAYAGGQSTGGWDPVQMSTFLMGGSDQPDASRLMGIFISFKEADSQDSQDSCEGYDHCCNVTTDIAGGLHGGNCDIGPPAWKCYGADGSAWAAGQAVKYVNYEAGLANSPMAASGKSLLIQLADTADVSVPISNTYAEHTVHDSPACRSLCAAQLSDPVASLFKDTNAEGCELAGEPQFRSKAGYGKIAVKGFGRVNGQLMMAGFDYRGKTVWSEPAMGALNGYGNIIPSCKNIAHAEAATRWRVMSGLVELSSAAIADPAAGEYAVDVSQITVGWGPVRGDGAIRLQFQRVPLDSGHKVEDSNQAVRLVDVKTPGTWLGASDGPRVTADGSLIAYSFNQHADDNFKVDSSNATMKHITLLSGNIGSAIELGTYGLGLRDNAVRHTIVDGVYIHRLCQGLNPDNSSQEDNLGSMLGSRTCPFGISFEDIEISNLFVPSLGGANTVSRLFAIGTYGAQGQQQFAAHSPLDRWFFCDNKWWRQEGDHKQTIQTTGSAASFRNLRFLNWTVMLRPQAQSLLYNFHTNASTTMNGVDFYDTQSPAARDGATSDLWPSGVKIYEKGLIGGDFVAPCLGSLRGDAMGASCWDKTGEIMSRRAVVCDGGSCNNFEPVIGSADSTHVSDVSFPWGQKSASKSDDELLDKIVFRLNRIFEKYA